MREIKFRAWDSVDRQFVYFELKTGVYNHAPPIYSWAQLEPWEQYTGLHDKNGRAIYEADILCCRHGHYVRVFWELGAFYREGVHHTAELIRYLEPTGWEVVGNIHEDPELLNA